MRSMKKILSVFTCGCLMTVGLAGCSGAATSGSAGSEKAKIFRDRSCGRPVVCAIQFLVRLVA